MIEKKNLEEFSDEIKYHYFIDAVRDFSKNKKYIPHSHNSLIQSLQLFLKFPYISSVSAYVLNPATFEFDHYTTLPEIMTQEISDIYPSLVNHGSIGIALSSDSLTYFPDSIEKESTSWYIILPLISSKGPNAIIILNVSKNPRLMPNVFLKFCDFVADLISFKIENELLNLSYITERQHIEQKVATKTLNLLRTNKELQEKFKELRSSLSMSLPHEIRTPLSHILGFTDHLKRNFENITYEDASEILDYICLSSRSLYKLFEHYLLYANLEILANNPIEIAKLQEKLSPSLEELLVSRAEGLAVINNRAEDLDLNVIDSPVSISEDYLNTIFHELLDNCFKYSNTGTSVKIATEIDENYATITFVNSGRIMTSDQIENIGAYTQFDRKTYEQQGSGLGLAIAKRIIEIHNGKFHIASDSEGITSVIVKLPVAKNFDF